jgi:glycosyltransferase involved in cell wall biosynthesis
VRVLVVSAVEPWHLQDGISLILHHQLPLLARDHELRVIVAEGPAPATDTDRSLHDRYQPPVALRTIDRNGPSLLSAVRTRLQSFRDGEPAHVHWVERPALLAAVRQELDGFQPQLLHLHGWGTAALHRLAPGTASVHAAIDSWNLGLTNRLVSGVHRLSDAGQRRRVDAHEKHHYPRLGAVTVVTPADADDIRTRTGCRAVVIRNGVDPGAEPDPHGERPAPVVAFHGVFTTEANVDALRHLVQDVLPRLQAARPDVKLIVIGRGSDRIDLPRTPALECTGEVVDVRPHLERAAVYVAPLVSGTGLKNKVLEAMAAGLPVVGTSLALESIGSGDGTIEANDTEAMVTAVLRLLDEPGAARREGMAGRQRVLSEFSWAKNVEQLAGLWSEVATTHRPS